MFRKIVAITLMFTFLGSGASFATGDTPSKDIDPNRAKVREIWGVSIEEQDALEGIEMPQNSVASSNPLGPSRTIHKKKFKCEVLGCGKLFSQKHHLTYHTRTHTGEKPFQCDQCNKSFSLKSNLTVHRRIHAGEKLFQCGQCGKSFSRKAHVTRHERNVHQGTA